MKMKIEVYSKDNCDYCTKIKALFDFHGLVYESLVIGDEHTKESIQERVGDVKKINTVPQVFVNDEYIGGYLEAVLWVAYDRHVDGQ